MALSDLSSPDAVKTALKEFTDLGREAFLKKYGFGRAREYFVEQNGERFDSKAIVAAAHGFQFPERGPLRSGDFSGGEVTVKAKLEELGFSVHVAKQPEEKGPFAADPHIWIEKTIVDNRPDREAGDYALGKKLWSPQRGENGADIYRFMREVRPGDIVLHLTDNEGFTGISIADAAAEEFNGLPNTAWSDRPSYFIRLRDFQRLEPPLHRDDFLRKSGFRERMLELLTNGLTNTFYARDGNLNQGKYLTPVPPKLMAILNDAYREVAGRDLVKQTVTDTDKPLLDPIATPQLDSDLKAIVTSFASALRASHIRFGNRHDELVRTFIASLASKRFLILTGLSGSGKTQLAIRFGEWLGSGRSLAIPVRPDWTGPEQLLGYEDALLPVTNGQRSWFVPDALAFILKAANDPASPYLLILDEMNLAHVERYFADVLSGMESNETCIPNLSFENGTWRRQNNPERIPFPENLFLVGTVNVDETTYAFSPKVLDRANTIEFRVSSTDLDPNAQKPIPCVPGAESLVREFLEISRDSNWHLNHPPKAIDDYKSQLLALHALLTDGRFEFGHRVFYEALRFAALLEAAGASDYNEALDFVILQKILPRLHGSRRNLEPTLVALEAFTRDPNGGGSNLPAETLPKMPRSNSRIARFKRILVANQFASFSD